MKFIFDFVQEQEEQSLNSKGVFVMRKLMLVKSMKQCSCSFYTSHNLSVKSSVKFLKRYFVSHDNTKSTTVAPLDNIRTFSKKIYPSLQQKHFLPLTLDSTPPPPIFTHPANLHIFTPPIFCISTHAHPPIQSGGGAQKGRCHAHK